MTSLQRDGSRNIDKDRKQLSLLSSVRPFSFFSAPDPDSYPGPCGPFLFCRESLISGQLVTVIRIEP